MAEFESSLISERVRLGMARARAQGKRISRPPIPGTKQREIVRLHKMGRSLRQIEGEIGVSRATAAKYVNAYKNAAATACADPDRWALRCARG